MRDKYGYIAYHYSSPCCLFVVQRISEALAIEIPVILEYEIL